MALLAKKKQQGDPRNLAQRRREEKQDAARGMLQAMGLVRGIMGVIKAADDAPPEKIPALRLKFDGYRALLAKVLPDLKAIEVTGDAGPPRVVIVPVASQTAEAWAAQVRQEREQGLLPGVVIEQPKDA